jgi:hypothetical protein
MRAQARPCVRGVSPDKATGVVQTEWVRASAGSSLNTREAMNQGPVGCAQWDHSTSADLQVQDTGIRQEEATQAPGPCCIYVCVGGWVCACVAVCVGGKGGDGGGVAGASPTRHPPPPLSKQRTRLRAAI